MNASTTLAYWVEAPGVGSLRQQPFDPGSTAVTLRAAWSGISPGTERLVGRGLVPAACGATMACVGMQGTFALPISYGYSLVGTIASGPWTGQRAFTMHPHHSWANVAAARLVLLPDTVPAARATLFPNLETALNGTWDAELAGDETVVVLGAGAVGLLLSFVLAIHHRGSVTLVEADPDRRHAAAALPWQPRVVAPDELPRGRCAVAFHASGTGSGLQLALDALGFEGRVVDLSWYGTQRVELDLGTSFHQQRLRLLGSQVGTIAPRHRAAGHPARTAAVLDLLADARLDALLAAPIPFAELPAWFARLYRGEPVPPCPLVVYPNQP